MTTMLNRRTYQQMVDEDLRWLLAQPRTLERDHIEQIVRDSVAVYYPANRGDYADVRDDDRPATTRQYASGTREARYVEHVLTPLARAVQERVEEAVRICGAVGYPNGIKRVCELEKDHQAFVDGGFHQATTVSSIPFVSSSAKSVVVRWKDQGPDVGIFETASGQPNMTTEVVAHHACVNCAGPCGCDQVDPETGLGCRKCVDCNRDAEIVGRSVPAGPEDFGGEDFPSQPSDETLKVIEETLGHAGEVVSRSVSQPVIPFVGQDEHRETHACVGCQRPDCDCGQTRQNCKECMSCSIPF